MLRMLSRSPRKIDTAALARRLCDEGDRGTRRTLPRDLQRLARPGPLRGDAPRPAGWSWAQAAAPPCGLVAPSAGAGPLSHRRRRSSTRCRPTQYAAGPPTCASSTGDCGRGPPRPAGRSPARWGIRLPGTGGNPTRCAPSGGARRQRWPRGGSLQRRLRARPFTGEALEPWPPVPAARPHPDVLLRRPVMASLAWPPWRHVAHRVEVMCRGCAPEPIPEPRQAT